MPITHSFVSAVADGADTSKVRPVDWNASHLGENTIAHGCRGERTSGDVSLGTTTLTLISFTSEAYDTDSIHDNSTNPSRFTIPTISGVTTGLWSVTACGYTDNTNTNGSDSMLRLNAAGNSTSGTVIAFERRASVTAGGGVTSVSIATNYVFSAGDYVEWFVRSLGASGNLLFDTHISPQLTIAYLGKVT